MKNYVVQSLIEFDDYEGLECIPTNKSIHRIKGSTFNCTEERAKYLISKGAVKLIEIKMVEELSTKSKEDIVDVPKVILKDVEEKEPTKKPVRRKSTTKSKK